MKSISVSGRARQTPASPIRRLAPLASQAKSQGVKVLHVNIGQPDLPSPELFFEGLRNYSEVVVSYESSQGNENLRRAWAAYLNKTLGLTTQPNHFLITTGASEALIFIFMCCCDPGDEVIIVDPTYANYIGFAAIAGVTLVPVESSLDENFALPPAEIINKKITARTKAILLCSPNNPTGTVYSRQELERLLTVCNERNLFFIVDETYREIVYDGLKPLSIFHLDSCNPRIIVVDSLSKRFSLCGSRLGCLITTNTEVMQACLNVAQARLASPTIEQHAAAYMLERIDAEAVGKLRSQMERRRDCIIRELLEIPGVTAHKPQGAFYLIARLPVGDSEDFASFMLSDFSCEGYTTFVAPAAGFYMNNGRGRNKIRIAFVLEEDVLVKAANILGEGLLAYGSR